MSEHEIVQITEANYPAPPYRPQAPAGQIFTVPTLIIWGMEEEYFGPAALDGLVKYYPGAGHWVHRDDAARGAGWGSRLYF